MAKTGRNRFPTLLPFLRDEGVTNTYQLCKSYIHMAKMENLEGKNDIVFLYTHIPAQGLLQYRCSEHVYPIVTNRMAIELNQLLVFCNGFSSQWKTPYGTPGTFLKRGITYLPFLGSSDMFTKFITHHNKTL